MVEPLVILVAGGIVGSILLTMYLPMPTVLHQIQVAGSPGPRQARGGDLAWA